MRVLYAFLLLTILSVSMLGQNQNEAPKVIGKSTVKIVEKTDEGLTVIEMENGNIAKITVDGKEIDPKDYNKYEGMSSKYDNKGFHFHFTNPFDNDSLGMNFGYQLKYGDSQNDKMPDLSRLQINSFSQNLDSIFRSLINGGDELGFFNFSEDRDFPNNLHLDMDQFNETFKQMLKDSEIGFDAPNNDMPFEFKDLKPKSNDKKLEDIIGMQLNKDGFLEANKVNRVELSGKYLKINEKKQPHSVWLKYKDVFEIETGLPLNKDTKLIFNIMGTEGNRKYKSF